MKKGKVVVTILLVIVVGLLMFIVGQYAASKTNYNLFKKSDKIIQNGVKNDEKDSESVANNDEKVLEEITKVYKDTFENIQKVNENDGMIQGTFSNNESIYTINEEIASKFFTDKSINYLENNKNRENLEKILMYSILGSTNKGVRPLKIVCKNSNYVVATGNLDYSSEKEIIEDEYPLYIIFKKVNNSYKIDMFE